jgi:tripartite-type tricarboxylate transporter receptor subunit TctC
MKKIFLGILVALGLCVTTANASNDPPRSAFKIVVAVPAGSGPDKLIRDYA